jgi:hypothetical protein
MAAVKTVLYTLRYKASKRGIQTSLMNIKARKEPREELAAAEKLGKQFCESQPGHLYLGVAAAFVVDETADQLDEELVPA